MRLAGRKRSTLWEWLIIIGLTAAAVAFAEISNVSQKWADAIVYTVVLFATVLLAARPAWGRRELWRTLIPLFLFHIVLATVLVQALPLGRMGFPKLLLIPAVILEGMLMLAVVWKRVTRREAHGKHSS